MTTTLLDDYKELINDIKKDLIDKFKVDMDNCPELDKLIEDLDELINDEVSKYLDKVPSETNLLSPKNHLRKGRDAFACQALVQSLKNFPDESVAINNFTDVYRKADTKTQKELRTQLQNEVSYSKGTTLYKQLDLKIDCVDKVDAFLPTIIKGSSDWDKSVVDRLKSNYDENLPPEMISYSLQYVLNSNILNDMIYSAIQKSMGNPTFENTHKAVMSHLEKMFPQENLSEADKNDLSRHVSERIKQYALENRESEKTFGEKVLKPASAALELGEKINNNPDTVVEETVKALKKADTEEKKAIIKSLVQGALCASPENALKLITQIHHHSDNDSQHLIEKEVANAQFLLIQDKIEVFISVKDQLEDIFKKPKQDETIVARKNAAFKEFNEKRTKEGKKPITELEYRNVLFMANESIKSSCPDSIRISELYEMSNEADKFQAITDNNKWASKIPLVKNEEYFRRTALFCAFYVENGRPETKDARLKEVESFLTYLLQELKEGDVKKFASSMPLIKDLSPDLYTHLDESELLNTDYYISQLKAATGEKVDQIQTRIINKILHAPGSNESKYKKLTDVSQQLDKDKAVAFNAKIAYSDKPKKKNEKNLYKFFCEIERRMLRVSESEFAKRIRATTFRHRAPVPIKPVTAKAGISPNEQLLKSATGCTATLAKQLVSNPVIKQYIDKINKLKGDPTAATELQKVQEELRAYVADIQENQGKYNPDLPNATRFTDMKKGINDNLVPKLNSNDWKKDVQGKSEDGSGLQGYFDNITQIQENGVIHQLEIDLKRNFKLQINKNEPIPNADTASGKIEQGKEAIENATTKRNPLNASWVPAIQMAGTQFSLGPVFGLQLTLLNQEGVDVDLGNNECLAARFSDSQPPPQIIISYNADDTIKDAIVTVKGSLDLAKRDSSGAAVYRDFMNESMECSLTYKIEMVNNKPVITVLDTKYELNEKLVLFSPPPLTAERRVEILQTTLGDKYEEEINNLKDDNISAYIDRIHRLTTLIPKSEELFVNKEKLEAELAKVKGELKAYVADIQNNKNSLKFDAQNAANLTKLNKFILDDAHTKKNNEEVEGSIKSMFGRALAKYDMAGEETEFETDFKRQSTFKITDKVRDVTDKGPIPDTTVITTTQDGKEFNEQRAAIAKKELADVTDLGNNQKWTRVLETAPTQTSLRAAFSNQIGTINADLGLNVKFSQNECLKAEISGNQPTVELEIIRGEDKAIQEVKVRVKGSLDIVKFDQTKEGSTVFKKDAITAELSYSIKLDKDGEPIISGLKLEETTTLPELGEAAVEEKDASETGSIGESSHSTSSTSSTSNL